MTNLESVLKRRHHFADKSSYSQGYDLSSSHVWMWELDHKKGRMPKNWCFWTVLLEKTLESHLSSKRSNQSILKEINPEYSLEGLMLKLKLQSSATWCTEPTHGKRPWIRERLKVDEKRATEVLDGITDSMDMNLGKLWEMVRDKEACLAAEHGIPKSQTRLGLWTTTAISTLGIL